MADQTINDFVPPEMRKFAEQSVQQAKKAFDEMMTATQRAVSSQRLEGLEQRWPHRPAGGLCRWPEPPLWRSTVPAGTKAR